MKNIKKFLSIAVILSLIIGGLTIVNAAEIGELTIDKIVRKSNKVIFTLELPTQEAGLNGDANNNGRVDEYKTVNGEEKNVDVIAIEEYIAEIREGKNEMLADYTLDGEVNVLDEERMKNSKELLTNPISLDGTLAQKSTYKLQKNAEGKFEVEVTVPNNEEGTIGIIVKPGVFKYASKQVNKEVKSTLFDVVKGTLNTISIENGVKDGSKVTFKINLPKDTPLKGDVNLDGKLDENDIKLINESIYDNKLTNVQQKAADVNVDSKINYVDYGALNDVIAGVIKYVTLNGDLAKDSKSELVKDAQGNYSVVVTLPENTEKGTIGVTLGESTFMYGLGYGTEKVSSKLLQIGNIGDESSEGSDENTEFKVIEEKKEKTDDGKIKVTITVNKELDKDKLPEGWELSKDATSISKIMKPGTEETITIVSKDGDKLTRKVITEKSSENSKDEKDIADKKDETTAKEKIPQTGVTNVLAVVIGLLSLVGAIFYIRSRKMLK